MGTSLFILFRTPDLNSDNQKLDQDPDDVCRSSSPSGCRTHGGPSSRNDFPESGRKWTTIRHTAFRLTLEEDPGLAIPPKINSFADNGHTSPDQLRNTYLRYIDAERTARESRQTIGDGKWTMFKRTDEDN